MTLTETIIAIDPLQIDRDPGQPRTVFHPEAQQRLEDSIRSLGILTPLDVVPCGDDRYRLRSGERRLRAALVVGLETVPCRVVAGQPLIETRIAQVLENVRAELTETELWSAILFVWRALNVRALEPEAGQDGQATDRLLTTELPMSAQLAVMAQRLRELTDLDEAAYLASGRVRVPWATVLTRFGLADLAPQTRKVMIRAIRDLDPAVIDGLAGIDVTQTTIQRLAVQPPEVQRAILEQAQAAGGDAGALTRALDAVAPRPARQPTPPPDEPAWDAPARESPPTFTPDATLAFPVSPPHVAPLRTNGAAPRHGSPPPAGHDAWSRDAVLLLTSALETVITQITDQGAARIAATDRGAVETLWSALTERMERLLADEEA